MKAWLIAFILSTFGATLELCALTALLLTISTLGLFWSWVKKELKG